MEVRILLCRRVLDRMPEATDAVMGFIQNWLSLRDTKAVVLPQDWDAFVTHWTSELQEFPESREPFFAMMRGIITPYRDKYATEANVEGDGDRVAVADEVEAMRIITGRHYATCAYLITDDPTIFQGKRLRLLDSRILTPELFAAESQAEEHTGTRMAG